MACSKIIMLDFTQIGGSKISGKKVALELLVHRPNSPSNHRLFRGLQNYDLNGFWLTSSEDVKDELQYISHQYLNKFVNLAFISLVTDGMKC